MSIKKDRIHDCDVEYKIVDANTWNGEDYKIIRIDGISGDNGNFDWDEVEENILEYLRDKRDDQLEKRLLKHYSGSEWGSRGFNQPASGGKYIIIGSIELRISDHSAGKRQSDNELSIITHEYNKTEGKVHALESVNYPVWDMPFKDIITYINKLILKKHKELKKDIDKEEFNEIEDLTSGFYELYLKNIISDNEYEKHFLDFVEMIKGIYDDYENYTEVEDFFNDYEIAGKPISYYK